MKKPVEVDPLMAAGDSPGLQSYQPRWQIKQGYIPKVEHILQVQCYETISLELLAIQNLNIVYVNMSGIVTPSIRLYIEWTEI